MTKTPAYHHGNLRQALIEAGAQLIEIKGVSGISLREVAKQTGVSHTAPYRHFKDKNALLAGITEVGFAQLAGSLQQVMIENPNAPKDQLIEAGVAYISRAIQNKQMHNLMFGGAWKLSNDEELIKQTSDAAFNGLVQIVKNGQQAGVFKKGDARVLALTAWSLVHGYAMLASTSQLSHLAASEDSILELARTAEVHLIEGLEK
ncbi:MAG: TetR/AcrR family transcriptional regulator [Gammaproteobacteria bacterium]|nr:TetR/AcrR family transcriptional regulator [Gammaproteobacteria bacterium]